MKGPGIYPIGVQNPHTFCGGETLYFEIITILQNIERMGQETPVYT